MVACPDGRGVLGRERLNPVSQGHGWRGETATVVLTRKGFESQVIKVKPRGSESVQQLLKRFKRLCQREGLTRDMKRNSYYEKPSDRRRRKSRKSARRASEAE